jgi:hypothetical protein
MPTRETRARAGQASNDNASFSSLTLGDFALLDKILLLEASLQRSPSIPDATRTALLQQVAALKDDIRVICVVLIGDAPARTGPVPIPVWARAGDTVGDDQPKERRSGG